MINFIHHGEELAPEVPLRRIKSKTIDTQLLERLRDDPTQSMASLSRTLDVSISVIRGALLKLQKNGKIVRIGQRQKGLWKVVDND